MSTTMIVFMVIVGIVIWTLAMVFVYNYFQRLANDVNKKQTSFESVETPGARHVTGATGPVARYAMGPTGPSFIKGVTCVSCRRETVSTSGYMNVVGVVVYSCHRCGCTWDSTYYRKEPHLERSNITCKLHALSRYPLSELFAELKFGRPAADQHYLDELIQETTKPEEEK